MINESTTTPAAIPSGEPVHPSWCDGACQAYTQPFVEERKHLFLDFEDIELTLHDQEKWTDADGETQWAPVTAGVAIRQHITEAAPRIAVDIAGRDADFTIEEATLLTATLLAALGHIEGSERARLLVSITADAMALDGEGRAQLLEEAQRLAAEQPTETA